MERSPQDSEHMRTEADGFLGKRRTYPMIMTFSFIAACTISAAAAPYMLARRQVSGLKKEMHRLSKMTESLQRELEERTETEVISSQGRHDRIERRLIDLMRNTESKQRLNDDRGKRLEADVREMRSDLQRLVGEVNLFRTRAASIPAIGHSLAEVAAFMHEVELALGIPTQQGRIDQLRRLAFHIHKASEDHKNPSPE